MLFATATLARRIEQAECALVSDMARAVSRRDPSSVIVMLIGGGAAVATGPGSPINKVAGMGFEAVDEAALAEVEREFERRGLPVQVELSSLGRPEIAAMLTRRGYMLNGFENVLALSPREARPAANDSVAVRRSTPDESRGWVDVITKGFAAPDSFDGPPSSETVNFEVLERIFDDIKDLDGFVGYLAQRDGSVAGAAAMRLSNGVAQLCGAATLTGHRRRGVQTTLLLTRLADAAREGCDIAIVTTQPGSKSQENVQRQGFSLLYTRAILVRSWPSTGG
jgi:ribosomal protein S18 acetylase RimI-like enzyme